MPFHDPFDFIYTDLLKETCKAHGLEVIRADDLFSTRQILEDIVKGIYTSDLIIADLTENNPNVFYELGIAHGLNKPVQIITQSVDDLPFDISAYRVFTYSMSADKYSKNKEDFDNLISRLVTSETTLFGNPLSDFLKKETPKFKFFMNDGEEDAEKLGESQESTKEIKGFWDHLSEFQSTSNEMNIKLKEITELTINIGGHFRTQTERIERINESSDQFDKISLARRLLIDSADKLGEYATNVEEFNSYFDLYIPQLQDNVEAIITLRKNEGIKEEEKMQNEKKLIDAIESTEQAIQQTNKFADVLDAFPNLQENFTKQSKRAALALKLLTERFSQIKALYIRLNETE